MSPPSFGRKQTKTLLWLDVGVDIVIVATRNLCWLSVLLQMKRTILWKSKMNQEENFVLVNHFSSTCGITETSPAPRCFEICATGSVLRYAQQALDDINWTVGMMSLMTSLLWRRTRLLSRTEFPTVSTGLLVALVRSSSFGLNQAVLEGSTIFYYIAESRSVFIRKTSDINDFCSPERNREFKLKYFKKLSDNNNIICLLEVQVKDEFHQAI